MCVSFFFFRACQAPVFFFFRVCQTPDSSNSLFRVIILTTPWLRAAIPYAASSALLTSTSIVLAPCVLPFQATPQCFPQVLIRICPVLGTLLLPLPCWLRRPRRSWPRRRGIGYGSPKPRRSEDDDGDHYDSSEGCELEGPEVWQTLGGKKSLYIHTHIHIWWYIHACTMGRGPRVWQAQDATVDRRKAQSQTFFCQMSRWLRENLGKR